MLYLKNHPSALFLSFVFISLSILSSCGKYDEGPALSLRSKKDRLANEWIIEKFTENEVDRTEAYLKNFDFLLEIDKDGDITIYETHKGTGFKTRMDGKWEFINDKELVEVVFPSDSNAYKIIRLKEEELWYSYSVTNQGNTTNFVYHMKEK